MTKVAGSGDGARPMNRWLVMGTVGCLSALLFGVIVLFFVIKPITVWMAWCKEVSFPPNLVVYQVCGNQLFLYERLTGRRRVLQLEESDGVSVRTPALRSDLGAMAYWRIRGGTEATLVLQYFDIKNWPKLYGPPQVLKTRNEAHLATLLANQNLSWSRDGQFLACYTYRPHSSVSERDRIRPVLLDVYESGTNRCTRTVSLTLVTSVDVPPYWTEENEIALWELGEGMRTLNPSVSAETWDLTRPVIPPVAQVSDSLFYFDFLDCGKKRGLYELSPRDPRPVHRMGWHPGDVFFATVSPSSGKLVYFTYEPAPIRKGQLRMGPPLEHVELTLVDVKNRTVSTLSEEADWCTIAGIMTP